MTPSNIQTLPQAPRRALLSRCSSSVLALSLSSVVALKSSAQDEQPVLSTVPGQMDSIEQLFSSGGSTEIIEDGSRQGAVGGGDSKASDKGDAEAALNNDEPETLAELVSLSALKDIAVIQKRFQPKTKRFEFFGGLNGILNDKFFSTFGASGRVGYALSERFAIEAIGILFTTTEKQVTSDLRDRRGVFTRSFVTPLSFYGLDFKWTPIYGKMGFVTENITPFDMYFSSGLGMTGTNQDESVPTFHIGTGQAFALSKGMSFRWDLSWIFYSATSRVSAASQTESTYNNLFITIGMSFLFPEASYR